MKQKFMPLQHCAAFGWAYGRLAALAPELATPGRYSLAAQLPMQGWGGLANAAMIAGKVSPEDVAEIGAAIAGIPPENFPANAEGESAFAMAYYMGLAGEPFSRPFDIAAARKTKGITQQALADALGIAQARIADWESGKVTPRPATMERIKEILA